MTAVLDRQPYLLEGPGEPRQRGPHGWTLRRRVGVLAVVLSVAVALASLWAAIGFTTLHATLRDQSRQIQPARSAVEVLKSGLLAEAVGFEDYLIRPSGTSLAHFHAGVRNVQTEQRRLPHLLARLPDLRRTVDHTLVLADAWRAKAVSETIALAGRSPPPGQVRRLLDHERPLFAAVVATFPALDAALARTDQRATGHVETTAGALALILILAGLVTFAAVLTSVVLVRRWVTRPIAALHDDISQVAGGDLGHEIARRGPPELAAMSSDAEAMRRRIVDELDSLRSAQAEIRRQAEELRRSNRDLEQFAYVASHDLQEPLRKVASFCELTERRYAAQLDERGRQYLHLAADGARRMQQLIKDVLALARIGRLEEDFDTVDLAASLDQARANLSVQLETTGAEVRSSGLPVVKAEPTLMAALFQNLLANSVKFRRPGRPPTIEVRAWAAGEQLEFSFTDDGIGIEAAYAERIFEMFQRLHSRDEHAGTGIGLALCRRIVEHHGGRIWLDTSFTEGACFRWSLPLTAVAPGGGRDGEAPRRDADG